MSEPRVVVFTRFPEPGRAKTRLIPALGPDGAAALHRRLAERTVAVVQRSGLPVELRVTGAAPFAFARWLGPLPIVEQGPGDLGERLARAAASGPVLLIGADAPDLTPELLQEAARALATADAVVGPAQDGGYWLLGLARPIRGVFDGIAWGTDAVLAQTLARLADAGVVPVRLATLADCDRPEDLSRWPDLSA